MIFIDFGGGSGGSPGGVRPAGKLLANQARGPEGVGGGSGRIRKGKRFLMFLWFTPPNVYTPRGTRPRRILETVPGLNFVIFGSRSGNNVFFRILRFLGRG